MSDQVFFTHFYTGNSGALPIIIANIGERRREPGSVAVGWMVRDGDTGWACSTHGLDDCEHTRRVIEILPDNLARYLVELEDQADHSGLAPHRKKVPAEARRWDIPA